jgi:hypothetical protein
MTALSSRSAAIVQARDVGTFTTPTEPGCRTWCSSGSMGRPSITSSTTSARSASRRARSRSDGPARSALHRGARDRARAGVAHRDIKPPNIFVIGDPRGIDSLREGARLRHRQGDGRARLEMRGARADGQRNHGLHAQLRRPRAVLAQPRRHGPVDRRVRHGADPGRAPPRPPRARRGRLIQLSVASRDPARRPTPRTLGVEVSDTVEAVFAKAVTVAPPSATAPWVSSGGPCTRRCFPTRPPGRAASARGASRSADRPRPRGRSPSSSPAPRSRRASRPTPPRPSSRV